MKMTQRTKTHDNSGKIIAGAAGAVVGAAVAIALSNKKNRTLVKDKLSDAANLVTETIAENAQTEQVSPKASPKK